MMSTTFESEHERCRIKVCVVCYEKASRVLSESQIETIQHYVIDGYSSTDPDFPCGVCTGCSIALFKKRKDPEFLLPIINVSYDPGRKLGLRSIDVCSCRICVVAKQNGLSALQSSRKKRKRGRPTSNTVPEHIKICSNCFTIISQGSDHTAAMCRSSKRTKVSNLLEITSPNTLHRAASRGDMSVIPLGRPKKMDVVRKNLFTSNDCAGIQQDLGISNSKNKLLLRDIRLASGSRSIIEKNALLTIQEKNHQLDNFLSFAN